MGTFENIIDHVLEREGRRAPFAGYVNHPADPGGETVSGVARKMNPNWPGWQIVDAAKQTTPPPHTSGEEIDRGLFLNPSLTRMIMDLYRAQYWNAIQGDRIPSAPIAYAMMDSVILAGAYSVGWAQGAANRCREDFIMAQGAPNWERLEVDNGIGAKTISTIAAIARAKMPESGESMVSVFVDHFFEIRREFHRARVKAAPENSVFLAGWMNRCDDVEKYCRYLGA